MKKLLLLALIPAFMLGCGSQASYTPSAWGPAGYCYYIYSPYECYGHHPGIPTLMPLYWHQRYAAYYDSPAYTRVYVPARYRSSATQQARIFERTYASQIKTAARSASWHSSDGKTVPGTKVSRSATFGSGGARSSGFSGGSFRSGSSSKGNPCASTGGPSYAVILLAKGSSGGGSGGGSGGRSGGNVGGGSGRNGNSLGSGGGRRSGRNC